MGISVFRSPPYTWCVFPGKSRDWIELTVVHMYSIMSESVYYWICSLYLECNACIQNSPLKSWISKSRWSKYVMHVSSFVALDQPYLLWNRFYLGDKSPHRIRVAPSLSPSGSFAFPIDVACLAGLWKDFQKGVAGNFYTLVQLNVWIGL